MQGQHYFFLFQLALRNIVLVLVGCLFKKYIHIWWKQVSAKKTCTQNAAELKTSKKINMDPTWSYFQSHKLIYHLKFYAFLNSAFCCLQTKPFHLWRPRFLQKVHCNYTVNSKSGWNKNLLIPVVQIKIAGKWSMLPRANLLRSYEKWQIKSTRKPTRK